MSDLKNPWVALVGNRKEGRDEVLNDLIARFRAQGLVVGGHRQIIVEREGRIIGHDLIDLTTGEQITLAKASNNPTICDLTFDDLAFDRARAWFDASESQIEILVAGKLESSNEGHWETLRAAFTGPPRVLLLLVRRDVLAPFALQLPDPVAALELPADQGAIDAFVAETIDAQSVISSA